MKEKLRNLVIKVFVIILCGMRKSFFFSFLFRNQKHEQIDQQIPHIDNALTSYV